MTTWTWFVRYVFLPGAALVLIANVVLGRRVEPDARTRIDNAEASGNFIVAESEYHKLIARDPRNLEWHRGYISAHLARPKYQGKHRWRDDGPLVQEYTKYSQSNAPPLADIGNYGLGLFHSIEGDYTLAMEFFNRVRDRSMPYLNNSVGYACQQIGRPGEAEAGFRKEIEIGGNVSGATANLARLLHESRRFEELSRMAADPRNREMIDRDILRHLDLRDHRYLRYAWNAIGIRRASPYGLLGAALVFVVWFLYLRRIDVFERERAWHAGLMTVAAMACSLCTIPLYDALRFGLGFRLNGHPANDVAYCILGIGLVEETVKVVPVLAVLMLTSVIDETVDYLVYGSLGGLGFAFMENLLYFDDSGLRTIATRAFSAAILHMTLTAMVMYGLLYGRYTNRRHPSLYMLLAFGGACVVHGIYDFWLVSPGWLGELSVFSFLVLIVAITRYGRALNTSMNLSEHMPPRHEAFLNITRSLCASLSAIVMLQYLVVALKYGADNANMNLFSTVVSSYVLILVILVSLGRFTITKGRWLPLFEKRRA